MIEHPIGACSAQRLLIGNHVLHVGRANGQALPGQLWSDPSGIDHCGHVSHRVADVSDALGMFTGSELLG